MLFVEKLIVYFDRTRWNVLSRLVSRQNGLIACVVL